MEAVVPAAQPEEPAELTVAAEETPTPSRAPTPQPDPQPAPAASAASEEQSSGLHLQVSALKSAKAAAALGARLENEGYPVKVREPEADGLVRVLVGPVSDSDQLSAMANRLREEGLKPFPKRL
jgi:cell division septation protein DedD